MQDFDQERYYEHEDEVNNALPFDDDKNQASEYRVGLNPRQILLRAFLIGLFGGSAAIVHGIDNKQIQVGIYCPVDLQMGDFYEPYYEGHFYGKHFSNDVPFDIGDCDEGMPVLFPED